MIIAHVTPVGLAQARRNKCLYGIMYLKESRKCILYIFQKLKNEHRRAVEMKMVLGHVFYVSYLNFLLKYIIKTFILALHMFKQQR